MKTLFVSLVAIFFAFFVGCQESSITDPSMNDTELNPISAESVPIDKDLINYYPGVVKLSGSIFDPSHRLSSFAKINGVVRYRLEKIYTDKKPPRSAIKVKLYINAELKSSCPNQDRPWTVINTAEEVFYISSISEQVQFFEKSFRVRNTCCGKLNLLLKFHFVDENLSLGSMRLVKVHSLIEPDEDPISK